MMISQKTEMEVKIGERSYRFECSHDSPLGEIHDALAQMKKYVVSAITEVQKNEEKESKKEEV